MEIDTPTLALVSSCIAVMQALAFVGVWLLNRGIPGLGHWAVGSALSAVSLLLILLRLGVDSPVLTRMLATVLGWAGAGFFYLGAAAFRGRRAGLAWLLIVSIPTLAGYVWYGFVSREVWLRPLFYSVPIVLFLGLGARELILEQRKGLRFGTRFLAFTSLLYALFFLFRCVFLVGSRADPEPLAGGSPHVLVFTGTVVWMLCFTIAVVLLVSQWQNVELARLQEARIDAAEQLALAERELASERAQRQKSLLLRDLHDGLGGLTANLVLLASMGRGEESAAERQELMLHIENLAVECNREVRILMDVLQSGAADWGAFLQELREYAKRLAAAHRLKLEWQVGGRFPQERTADSAAQLSLMRCLKEALHNLVRHSGARHAAIRIRFLGGGLGIAIRDDGKGFGWETGEATGGRGLANMQRRCEELGGRVTLGGRPGTCLRFVLPLPLSIVPMTKKQPVSGVVPASGKGQS